VRVLTWNVFHGRAVPDRRGSLLPAFADVLAAWEWDVALLQEVPPWWGPRLGAATRASARSVPTSRNWLLPLRRLVADRRPQLLGSWGGGANVILVRGQAIVEHRSHVLRCSPERRVVHAVRVADGTWLGNYHGQVHSEARAQADLRHAAGRLLRWAGPSAPAVLGGDTNTFRPVDPAGLRRAGGHRVDHVFARGLRAARPARRLERGGLSDHSAILVELVREDSPPRGVQPPDVHTQGGPST
jgi:endonuclease/exonuclease/phosphatase (EEP) superfamily protein YafD